MTSAHYIDRFKKQQQIPLTSTSSEDTKTNWNQTNKPHFVVFFPENLKVCLTPSTPPPDQGWGAQNKCSPILVSIPCTLISYTSTPKACLNILYLATLLVNPCLWAADYTILFHRTGLVSHSSSILSASRPVREFEMSWFQTAAEQPAGINPLPWDEVKKRREGEKTHGSRWWQFNNSIKEFIHSLLWRDVQQLPGKRSLSTANTWLWKQV